MQPTTSSPLPTKSIIPLKSMKNPTPHKIPPLMSLQLPPLATQACPPPHPSQQMEIALRYIGFWNVRGWGNGGIREEVICHFNLDIVCLCETFLIKEEVISLPGYVWYSFNRKSISKRAIRGSGGVGILLKDWVVHQCDILVLDSSFEGILWLQLTNKQTQYKLCVCVCYLPPSNSSRGDISHDFFDSLKTMVYKYHCEGDFFYMWRFQC